MKTAILTLCISTVTLCAAAADTAFDCVITADRATYVVGEVPNITFRITNKTANDVVLVGSLDGSEFGRQFPKCRLEILDAAGKPVTAQTPRCGNMDTLKTTDFVVVPAGDAFNPFSKGFTKLSQFYRFPVTTPGDYALRFYYSTSDRSNGRDQNNASPEIQRLSERVPMLDLKSNELKLKFTPKPK